MSRVTSRRGFLGELASWSLLFSCGGLLGCEDSAAKLADILGMKEAARTIRQEYEIAPRLLRVAPIDELLNPVQKITAASVVVFRDEKGWSALSSRCSRDGCDLSFPGDILYCPCCRSKWALDGRLLGGKARHPLPWFRIGLRDRLRKDYYESINEPIDLEEIQLSEVSGATLLSANLYVHTGLKVPTDFRFTTPEIEDVTAPLRARVAEGKIVVSRKISKTLLDPSTIKGYWEDSPLSDEQLGAMYNVSTFKKELSEIDVGVGRDRDLQMKEMREQRKKERWEKNKPAVIEGK